MTGIYGTPISAGVREGDLNALVCGFGVYFAAMSCLGYRAVRPFDSSDGERFIGIITSKQPVKKKSTPAQ